LHTSHQKPVSSTQEALFHTAHLLRPGAVNFKSWQSHWICLLPHRNHYS
jgi:hypothetical protein